MSKVINVLTVVIMLGVISAGCDVLNNDSDSTKELKEVGSFPMEVGTVWVYETEEIGDGYKVNRTDSLFLFDTYEDYYALSYEPFNEAMLVNLNNEIVTEEGYVDESGSVEIYETPYLQFMYKETDGYIATSNLTDYDWWGDSNYLKVTYFETMAINGETYEDVYEMIISADEELGSSYGKVYYNSQGMLKIVEHDESDGTYDSTTLLTDILTDTYPVTSVFESTGKQAKVSGNGDRKSLLGKLVPGI